jgi:hypothetical protein
VGFVTIGYGDNGVTYRGGGHALGANDLKNQMTLDYTLTQQSGALSPIADPKIHICLQKEDTFVRRLT